MIASLTILFGALWGVSYSAIVALRKSKMLAYASMLQITMQAVVSVGLALAGFGAIAPIIGFLAGLLAGFALAASIIMRETGTGLAELRPTLSEIKRLTIFSLPLGLSGTALSLIANFSLVFLGYYSTSVILGNYSVISRVGNFFDVFLASISLALLPLFSATFNDASKVKDISKYYNYAIYFALLFVIPALFYIIALAKQVSYTAFTGVYTYAPLYLVLMCVGILISIPYLYSTNLFVGAGKIRKVVKYNVAVAALQLVLLPILIPTLNGLGLTLITFIITPIAFNLLYARKLHQLYKIKLEIGVLSRLVGAGVVSALLIAPLRYFIGGSFIPVLVIAALEQLIIYPPLIAYMGGIDEGRIEVLRRITGNLPVVNAVIRLLTDYTSIFLRWPLRS